jgi:hypothetical protein
MNANGSLTTNPGWYWERSRSCNGSSYVCDVYVDGSATDNGNYNNNNYLAPAFVIG